MPAPTKPTRRNAQQGRSAAVFGCSHDQCHRFDCGEQATKCIGECRYRLSVKYQERLRMFDPKDIFSYRNLLVSLRGNLPEEAIGALMQRAMGYLPQQDIPIKRAEFDSLIDHLLYAIEQAVMVHETEAAQLRAIEQHHLGALTALKAIREYQQTPPSQRLIPEGEIGALIKEILQ